MSFDPYIPLQQCNPNHDFERYPDYVNGFDSNLDGLFASHVRIPQPTSMDRYLQESEPRFFRTPSFPDIVGHTLQPFPDCLIDRRRSSPVSNGSHASSYISSGWSDGQESPHSSPMVTEWHISPHTYNDGVSYAYGGHSPLEHHAPLSIDVCNMQEIQKCADHVQDVAFEAVGTMHFSAYGAFAQEGYQPLPNVDDCASDASCYDETPEPQPVHSVQSRESESPVIRRRRAQSRSGPPPVQGGRITKRPHAAARHTSSHSTATPRDTINRGSNNVSGSRAFPCPLTVYGCSSSFGSKNEWKRHVNTQHMRLGFWRCDQCTSANKPNDFNRKDLFMQHVRRMHTPEDTHSNGNKRSGSKSPKSSVEEPALHDAAARCYKLLRSSPENSACLFCDEEFHGRDTWDTRMEHIGRHMETAKKENKEPEDPRDWRVDEMVQTWMASEQIIVPHGNKRWKLATP